jgi:anaerobic dimethyl sulfoxide reductase subunit B (iron-sulfur subunit)
MNWRRVETFERGIFPDVRVSFVSLSCLHCFHPPCFSVCPSAAIFKQKEDGIVLVDSEKCIGQPNCGLCFEACPYRIPQFNPDCDLKMEKCNLCLDRLIQGKQPICVDACPMHALEVAPMSELSRRYGDVKTADGFDFSSEANPSIIVRGKDGLQQHKKSRES